MMDLIFTFGPRKYNISFAAPSRNTELMVGNRNCLVHADYEGIHISRMPSPRVCQIGILSLRPAFLTRSSIAKLEDMMLFQGPSYTQGSSSSSSCLVLELTINVQCQVRCSTVNVPCLQSICYQYDLPARDSHRVRSMQYRTSQRDTMYHTYNINRPVPIAQCTADLL